MIKRTLKITALVLLVVVAVFFAAGFFAKVPYTGSENKLVHAPAIAVWQMMDDTKGFSESRHEVRYAEMMPPQPDGKKRWREHTMLAGDMYYEIEKQVPGELLVIRMLRSDFGMSGTWEFRFQPQGENTLVTVQETSVTDGLVMRSILNALGRNANMHLLLKAIESGVNKKAKV